MYLEVYPDIIFIINLFIDFILLFLLKKVNRKSTKFKRLFLASCIGASCAVLVSIFPMMHPGIRFLILNVFAAFFMIRIAFGSMRIPQMLKQILMLYIITFSVGGMLNSLYYHTNVREYLIRISASLTLSSLSALYILIMILCLIPITYAILWFLRWYESEKRDTYIVELFFEDNSICTKGLMDTGNCLYDPVFHKPVMVLEESIIRKLLSEEHYNDIKAAKCYLEGNAQEGNVQEIKAYSSEIVNVHKIRFIPYQSVGKARGMMPGFVLDKVLIHTEREIVCNEKVTAAICDNLLSTKEEYHVIIHKGLI